MVEAMEASLNMQQTPSKDAEATVASVMLAHGRVLLTVANEFPEASREYRQCHAKALQALQTAKQAGATGCYLLATEARLDWAIRGRPKLPLECLTTLRVAVLKDASIGKSARVCILSDASAVIGDIALKLMNREVNFIDIDGEGEHKGEISIALLQTLVTASSYEHRFSCGESTLPVYIEDDCSTAASLSQKNDLLWLSIINCVANFRECRWKDNHDFRCVYGLAQLIQGLAISSVQPPAWAIAQLTRLDVSELTLDAAFAEIYKLFVKRVPQLVAVWSQGKAVHEWDLELQRTYNFEALRRKDTHLFLSLAESCLHMKPALDLLRDALSLSSKKQTATVRWVVDRAVQCVAGIALHGQHPAQEVPSMLNVVFEVFQATHNRIAVRTLYRLQRGLLRLYCLRSAEAGEEEQVTLADCLSACFSEYGERRSDAPIRFHMGLYDAEATAIQQRQREKTLQEEGEGDVDVEMGVNGGECGAGGDLGGGGLW